MIFLDVPYSQKDDAKALGARWDAESRRWYVPKGALATPFAYWMPKIAPGRMPKMIALEAKNVSAGLAPETPKRKLSKSVGAVRSRAKKLALKAEALERAASREDDVIGKIIIGAGYVPAEGATGLPWA